MTQGQIDEVIAQLRRRPVRRQTQSSSTSRSPPRATCPPSAIAVAATSSTRRCRRVRPGGTDEVQGRRRLPGALSTSSASSGARFGTWDVVGLGPVPDDLSFVPARPATAGPVPAHPAADRPCPAASSCWRPRRGSDRAALGPCLVRPRGRVVLPTTRTTRWRRRSGAARRGSRSPSRATSTRCRAGARLAVARLLGPTPTTCSPRWSRRIERSRPAGASSSSPGRGTCRAHLLDLVAVMDRLRSPGGCPWDAEQTHDSLVEYLVEEAYETVEAIETGDDAALREELGDLLLQVVFHARIAEEHDEPWSIDDVADGIVDKLVARHPHVFADGDAAHRGRGRGELGRRSRPPRRAASRSPTACPWRCPPSCWRPSCSSGPRPCRCPPSTRSPPRRPRARSPRLAGVARDRRSGVRRPAARPRRPGPRGRRRRRAGAARRGPPLPRRGPRRRRPHGPTRGTARPDRRCGVTR